MFSNVFFSSPIKKSFASLYELVQLSQLSGSHQITSNAFQVCPRDLKMFFFGPSISYTKMDWNRWKRPPPPAFWRHFPASRRRTSKALGLKSRIYLRWRMRFNETSMNPLSFWKCLFFFCGWSENPSKIMLGKWVPQRRWVYSCKPGLPKLWKRHDGTGRIDPHQALF